LIEHGQTGLLVVSRLPVDRRRDVRLAATSSLTVTLSHSDRPEKGLFTSHVNGGIVIPLRRNPYSLIAKSIHFGIAAHTLFAFPGIDPPNETCYAEAEERRKQSGARRNYPR
jgi:hypothetical protein